MAGKEACKVEFKLSFRRFYLDRFLLQTPFSGDVLDIGGKKGNKRGSFRPPLSEVQSWRYVNIDPDSQPDYRCSAEHIPLPDASVDTILMCEVLEHLQKPEEAITESHRLLKPGGRLILSVPFLFPIHADPDDYQRWTPAKIRRVLEQTGYSEIDIQPMGSVFAVIFDLLDYASTSAARRSRPRAHKFFRERILRSVKPIFLYFDERSIHVGRVISTGFFVSGKK